MARWPSARTAPPGESRFDRRCASRHRPRATPRPTRRWATPPADRGRSAAVANGVPRGPRPCRSPTAWRRPVRRRVHTRVPGHPGSRTRFRSRATRRHRRDLAPAPVRKRRRAGCPRPSVAWSSRRRDRPARRDAPRRRTAGLPSVLRATPATTPGASRPPMPNTRPPADAPRCFRWRPRSPPSGCGPRDSPRVLPRRRLRPPLGPTGRPARPLARDPGRRSRRGPVLPPPACRRRRTRPTRSPRR